VYIPKVEGFHTQLSGTPSTNRKEWDKILSCMSGGIKVETHFN